MRMSTYLVFTAVVLLSNPALGREDTEQHALPTVNTAELLERIGRNAGLEFLLERDVPPVLVTGTVDWRAMDYDLLHTVLRNNGLAAVKMDDVVNIVPVSTIRQYPIPLVADGETYPDDLWVTRTYQTQRIPAAVLVPILRPLLPKQGHLVAEPRSNILTMVARYANTERLLAQVREMDAYAPEPQDEKSGQ